MTRELLSVNNIKLDVSDIMELKSLGVDPTIAMDKLGLSIELMAFLTGYTSGTIASWRYRTESRYHREPPENVRLMCGLLLVYLGQNL